MAAFSIGVQHFEPSEGNKSSLIYHEGFDENGNSYVPGVVPNADDVDGAASTIKSRMVDQTATGARLIGLGFTDISIKGELPGGLGIAAEYNMGDSDNTDASLLHIWKTISGITYHVAGARWDKDDNGWNIGKFDPLGVSILGTANGVNGVVALGNVNQKAYTTDGFRVKTDVIGGRVDMKIAGLGVQLAVGKLDLGGDTSKGESETFKDIIVTKPLGKGSKLKMSYGEWGGGSSFGTTISAKF